MIERLALLDLEPYLITLLRGLSQINLGDQCSPDRTAF
jgi:hypothetical protein